MCPFCVFWLKKESICARHSTCLCQKPTHWLRSSTPTFYLHMWNIMEALGGHMQWINKSKSLSGPPDTFRCAHQTSSASLSESSATELLLDVTNTLRPCRGAGAAASHQGPSSGSLSHLGRPAFTRDLFILFLFCCCSVSLHTFPPWGSVEINAYD